MSEISGVAIWLIGFFLWRHRLSGLGDISYKSGLKRAARSPFPRISVIVPARNEAHNLPALLASLKALSPAPEEIIVVDDSSTDGTGAIATEAGVTVTRPTEPPPGWVGKPWACAHGASLARGELLLFTDADTIHAPDSLGRAVEALEHDDAELLSVVPTHQAVARWESLQGIFHLLLLIATGGPRGAEGRGFAIGQYLLFRRQTYERLGGHTSVGGRIAEDLALARRVREMGGQTALLVAPGCLFVRMYPEGFSGFLAGWRRSFREGLREARLRGLLEIFFVIGWLLGLPIAVVRGLVFGDLLTLAWAAPFTLLSALEISRRQRAVGEFPALSALCYPLFVCVFIWVSLLAAKDRITRSPGVWKGRKLPVS